SLQFDPVALAPTYRLTKGIPGRSYGISIARRLNLPNEVLARAEERIPTDERRVTALLAELETREKELAAIEREIRELKAASEQGEEAAREARKRVENLAGEQGRELDRIAREATTSAEGSENTEVNVGDFVEVSTLGGRVGRIVELRAGEAVVAVGVMKLAVPRTSLRVSNAETAAPEVAVA